MAHSVNRKISATEAGALWAAAAGRCSICHTSLLRDETTDVEVKSGEMAHVVGVADTPRSPRGSHPLAQKERNKASNLILLCEKHHTEVDKRPDHYTVDRLREMKHEWEERVFFLTSLKSERRTMVLRVIGTIHGLKVPDISREHAREVVLRETGRFPRHDLSSTEQGPAVDLRSLTNEGTPAYWAEAERQIAQRIQLLRDIQSDQKGAHLSVFGLARIPVLVALGNYLGDASDVTVFHRRNDAGWGWDASADLPAFDVVQHSETNGSDDITMMCSLSGPVQLDRAPAELRQGPVYELRPVGREPGYTLLDHPEAGAVFAEAYRDFLSMLERDHGGAQTLNLLPAVPIDAAITLGRSRTPAKDPALRIYDLNRDSNQYEFACGRPMKFESEFDRFLEKVVNLSPGRLKTLRDRTAAIESLLGEADEPKLVVRDARPQGSLAQKTIINPLDEKRGFDADLLVELDDRFESTNDMICTVKRVIADNPRYADKVRLKRRCVTLEYAGEFRIDVVPCVRRGGTLYIGSRETDEWEATDPDGYSAWLWQRDEWANGYLVPSIRLIKYLKALKRRPNLKSVILSTLLAAQVEGEASWEMPDLPTTLVVLLESLADWCGQFSAPPRLTEPTCSAELRMDGVDWAVVTDQLRSLARRTREALDEPDEARSLAYWRKLFGSRFPSPQLRLAEAVVVPGEQDLYRDLGIPTDITDLVSLNANVRPVNGSPGSPIHISRAIPKDRGLTFEIASTTAPEPFDVYWKVRNSGAEAARLNALRGEITRDDNGRKAYKTESTAYTGEHWVKIYIVKDGVCVAVAHQNVPIG